MSHATCLVIVDEASSPEEAEAKAEEMMAPYDENLEGPERRVYLEKKPQDQWFYADFHNDGRLGDDPSWAEVVDAWNSVYEDSETMYYDSELDRAYQLSTYNPESRWDWYELGGRWAGYFLVKAGVGAEVMPGAHYRSIPESESHFEAEPGRADIVRKCDVDWEFMSRDIEISTEAFWDEKVAPALAGLGQVDYESYQPFSYYLGLYGQERIDQARTEYWSQPLAKAVRNLVFMGGPEELCLPAGGREAYVRQRRMSAAVTFAVLDNDGWHESGQMGWFGMASNEKPADVWADEFAAILSRHPDDAWLVLMDYHI